MRSRYARDALLLLLTRRLVRVAGDPAALALRPGWPSDVPEGSKRLIFIRHAEGLHNADSRSKPKYFTDRLGETMAYWDSRLTPLGRAQAHTLAPGRSRPYSETSWRPWGTLLDVRRPGPH